LVALGTDDALAILAGRAGLSALTGCPLWPRRTGFACCPWLALWADWTGSTWWASRPRQARLSRGARRACVARNTGLAVLDGAQPLGNLGPERRDDLSSLRLDQFSLARPLFALLRERMTERVSPSLEQSISLW